MTTVKIIRSFNQPFLTPFRVGEIVNVPDDKEARTWIAGGLAQPFIDKDVPQFASLNVPSRKK